MRPVLFVGARPNFVKAAPIIRELESRGHKAHVVHTQQHKSLFMSQRIWEDVGMGSPDYELMVEEGKTRACRHGLVVAQASGILELLDPEFTIVVGDVDSTLSCALASKMTGIPVVHYEAGLRSGDERMPEELNRIVVDHMSDLLLCSLWEGMKNLKWEGIHNAKFVGNTMIDSLRRAMPDLEKPEMDKPYAVATFHRPENVDDQDHRSQCTWAIMEACAHVAEVLLVAHPRLADKPVAHDIGRVKVMPPMGYVHFLSLVKHADFVITDSGGVQEETTALGVPCFTFRQSTERRVTVEDGTNTLTPTVEDLRAHLKSLYGQPKKRRNAKIAGWDGLAARRVVNQIEEWRLGL